LWQHKPIVQGTSFRWQFTACPILLLYLGKVPIQMKNISTCVLTLIFAALLFSSAQGQTSPVQPAPAPAPVKKHPLDKGDFKVGFSPATRAKTPKKAMPADEKAAFQEIAASLNTFIALPRDIYLN